MLHLASEARKHMEAGKLATTMQMTLVSSCLYSASYLLEFFSTVKLQRGYTVLESAPLTQWCRANEG